jgi:hypothetical protein
MEHMLIIGLTLFLSWSIINTLNKKRIKFLKKTKYRQSYIYEITKSIIPQQKFNKPKVISQSQKHVQKNMLRVIITEGKAYWILDNVFYSAIAVNGRVNEDTVKPLNFENMSKKELDKMLSILDDLKQGVELNDSGSAGNQGV